MYSSLKFQLEKICIQVDKT